jgi:twitching motility two-component system response regulator PilG
MDAGAAARAVFSSRLADAQADGPVRARILVVDDSRTVRRQLEAALEQMGFVCDAVADGRSALERLAQYRYDLAMVDVVIPDINGYQLTREFRRRQRGLPVLILSSKDSPFDHARGLLAGCSSYLAKPVPLAELEAALKKALRKAAPARSVLGTLAPTGPLTAAARH